MTKKEAKALLAMQGKILKALDSCERQLKGDQLSSMQHYWGNRIRQDVLGMGYASAPITQAEEVLRD